MIATKTPISEILRNAKYAIKITSVEQAKELLPDYPHMDDLQLFFKNDPRHAEYIGSICHPVNGPELKFVHPENKTIIEFKNIDIN